MLYTIDELRQKLCKPVYEVYEIFQNHFGEEHTDLQRLPDDTTIKEVLNDCNIQESESEDTYEIDDDAFINVLSGMSNITPYIYVWWPEVRVTNEFDKYVDIQDLYARIKVTLNGRIPYTYHGFELTRSTFSDIQWSSRYIHSHVMSREEMPRFSAPCLGRGPINNTIMDLRNSYEEALWMLFCEELSRYVTVESLSGVPYRKLEEISRTHKLSNVQRYEHKDYKDLYDFFGEDDDSKSQFNQTLIHFTDYFLSLNTLQLSFIEGRWKSGMPYFDYMIAISNAFISWFNNQFGHAESADELFRKEILQSVVVKEGTFYQEIHTSTNTENFNGRYLMDFKGQPVNIRIFHSDSSETRTAIILHHTIAMFLLDNILRIINYHYKNEHNRHTETDITNEDSASAYQTVFYL